MKKLIGIGFVLLLLATTATQAIDFEIEVEIDGKPVECFVPDNLTAFLMQRAYGIEVEELCMSPSIGLTPREKIMKNYLREKKYMKWIMGV